MTTATEPATQPVSPDMIRMHRAAITSAHANVIAAWDNYADAYDAFTGQMNQLGRYLDTLIGEGPAETDSGPSIAVVIANAAYGRPAPFPTVSPYPAAIREDRSRGC